MNLAQNNIEKTKRLNNMNPTKSNIEKTKRLFLVGFMLFNLSFLYIVFSGVCVVQYYNREKTKIEQYEPR
jgi:hypothetical protein